MLNPLDEKYYRNTLNDFGLGSPRNTHAQTTIISSPTSVIFLFYVPVGYVTVRLDNKVLQPTIDYNIIGNQLLFTTSIGSGTVIAVYDSL